MITSLRNSPSLRQWRSSFVTEMPPLAGGGGYTINLETKSEERGQLHHDVAQMTCSLTALQTSLSLDDWSREGGLQVSHVLLIVLIISARVLAGGHTCAGRDGDLGHRGHRGHRSHRCDFSDQGDVGDFGGGLSLLLQRGKISNSIPATNFCSDMTGFLLLSPTLTLTQARRRDLNSE